MPASVALLHLILKFNIPNQTDNQCERRVPTATRFCGMLMLDFHILLSNSVTTSAFAAILEVVKARSKGDSSHLAPIGSCIGTCPFPIIHAAQVVIQIWDLYSYFLTVAYVLMPETLRVVFDSLGMVNRSKKGCGRCLPFWMGVR